MARERFYFYEKWWKVIKDLNDQSALATFKAACALVFDGEDTQETLDSESRVAFMFMKQEIERDQEAYNMVVERNRTNGANGGRPRKTQENPKNPMGYTETQENPSEPDKNRKDKIRIEENTKNGKKSLSVEDENEREREIYKISLLFLRKGVVNPADEARDYYNYYQASGWRKSNEHQTPIIDKITYAETWNTKRGHEISKEEGGLWADLIEAVSFTNLQLARDFINDYRGCIIEDDEEGKKIRVFFSKNKTRKTISKLLNEHLEFNKRIFTHLDNLGIATFISENAITDPRR